MRIGKSTHTATGGVYDPSGPLRLTKRVCARDDGQKLLSPSTLAMAAKFENENTYLIDTKMSAKLYALNVNDLFFFFFKQGFAM